MKPCGHVLVAIAAAATAAGCGEPPRVGDRKAAPAAPRDDDRKAAPRSGGADAPAAGSGEGASYDPALDPLVNPASLTQAFDGAIATEDEWLVSTLDGNPQTLNPLFASSNYEFRFSSLLWNGPFTFDAKMDWAVNKDLVEKLDVSPDNKVWTLKLKPGFTWQDGVPYTAHDIVFSWKVQLDEHVPVTDRDGVLRLASVTAIDDLTVQYVVKDPSPMSKWDVNFTIIPRHLYEKGIAEDPTLKASDYYSKLNRAPVGSGPFRFVEWKENDKIVLERWDGFKGAKGHFKRIIFRIIPEANVQLLTFEKGETDEMLLQSKQFAIETVRSEAFRKVGVKGTAPQWLYSYLCWNTRGNRFFADSRVRRAMTMATNIPLMIEKITYRLNRPATGPFHRDSWMYNPDIQLLPFDLAASAKLLDEAGWAIDPETGWRKKGDTAFSFTLLMPQGNPATVEMAAIIQQDLKSIGVEMKTQVIEWATFQERSRKHEFEASTAAWGTGVDPDLTRNIFGTKAIDDGRNYGCYSNPRVDELYDKGQKEFDPEKRKLIYREIGKLIYDDQPYTFLWSRPTLWAFNKRIRGVTYSPRGVWNFDPSVLGWWVEKKDQLYNLR